MEMPTPIDPATRIRELETALETLRQQCRDKIRESLAKYRRVIDATSEGFLQLDLDHRIVGTNTALEGLLGYDGKSLLGRPVEDLYHKESVYIHFASKAHLSFEALFDTGQGTQMSLLFKRSVLSDGEGAPTGYLVFLTDLTELKQAQEDPWSNIAKKFKVGEIIKGKVTKIASFGAFIEMEEGIDGLVHISQISNEHIERVRDALTPGQDVEARVVKIDSAERRIGLSIKAATIDDKEFEVSDDMLEGLRPGEDLVDLAGAFDDALSSLEEWHPGDKKA